MQDLTWSSFLPDPLIESSFFIQRIKLPWKAGVSQPQETPHKHQVDVKLPCLPCAGLGGRSTAARTRGGILDSHILPMMSASAGRRRGLVSGTPGLLSKHWSICPLICVLTAGSVPDPELIPYRSHTPLSLQEEVHARFGARRARIGQRGWRCSVACREPACHGVYFESCSDGRLQQALDRVH